MRFKQPGPWLFAIGMVGIGIAALPLIMPFSTPPTGALAPVLVVAGAALLFTRTSLIAAVAVALCWLASLAPFIPGLIGSPTDFDLWVSMAKALTFATVAAAFAHRALWPAARVMLGLTVALFGGVHLLNPPLIGSILPDWFPVAGLWPYVTGVIQIIAGMMIFLGVRTSVAAFAIGLMWLSWIPLVHLQRVLDTPDMPSEWGFMLAALALAGAAWSVGEQTAARIGEVLQPSVR